MIRNLGRHCDRLLSLVVPHTVAEAGYCSEWKRMCYAAYCNAYAMQGNMRRYCCGDGVCRYQYKYPHAICMC